MSVVDQTKTFLAEVKHRIALHDLVSDEIKKAGALMTPEKFPAPGSWSKDEFAERVNRYQTSMADLVKVQALLGYWGSEQNTQTTALAPARLADDLKPSGGLVIWGALRWYPIFLLVYAGGIAAVAAHRYDNLRLILHALSQDADRSQARVPIVRAMVAGIGEAGPAFKELPGLERHYTPLSDHLFEQLRSLDQLLLLGAEYEAAFDEFEVLFALEHAEQYSRARSGAVWGPVGRFGWKSRSGSTDSPFQRVVSEAQARGGSWPPIAAGLFGGSVKRFEEIATEFGASVGRLGWS